MLKITPINESAVTGTWTVYRGVKLKVARAGNDGFSKLFANLTRPHKYQMEKGTLDNDTMESIMCESIGTCILVGWDDFKVDGKVIKYSVQNSIDLLTNDSDCRDFVQDFSHDVENFLKDQEDQVEGK